MSFHFLRPTLSYLPESHPCLPIFHHNLTIFPFHFSTSSIHSPSHPIPSHPVTIPYISLHIAYKVCLHTLTPAPPSLSISNPISPKDDQPYSHPVIFPFISLSVVSLLVPSPWHLPTLSHLLSRLCLTSSSSHFVRLFYSFAPPSS